MEKKNKAVSENAEYNLQNKILETNPCTSLNTVDINVLNLPVKKRRESN